MAEGGDLLPERLLKELKNRSRPVTTLELAKSVGVTRKQANPVLYNLERQGKIRKVQQQPPTWIMSCPPRSEVRPSTWGPGQRGRGRGRGAWLSRISASGVPVGVGDRGRPQTSGFYIPQNSGASPVCPPSSPQTGALQVKLVGLLGRSTQPQTALELARALGYPSRKAVNPTLYALEKDGAILRIEGQGPPKWSLRTSQQVAFHRSSTTTTQYAPSMSPFESQSHFSDISGNPFIVSPVTNTEESMESNLSGEESMDTEESSSAWPSLDLSHIPPENIKERLLAVMQAEPSLLQTDLELAKAIGKGYTRSAIRPCLEELASEGRAKKIGSSFPIKWGVAGDGGGSIGPDPQVPLGSQVERLYIGATSPPASHMFPSIVAVSSLAGGSSSTVSSINDLNRNPVSALNEYCQTNKLELKLDVVREFGPPHRKHFVFAASFGDKYFEAESTNKKDGKRMVADLALQHVMASQSAAAPGIILSSQSTDRSSVASMQTQTASSGGDSFSNMIAKMSQDIYVQLQGTVAVPQPGRKVVAAFVMEDTLTNEMKVVAVGSGTRCITGDQMSLEGLVVNDSHAEVVARRSLMRFFYQQLVAHSQGDQGTIFIGSATTSTAIKSKDQRTLRAKVKVRDNLKFHLYISTAPCGDSAQFSRSDDQNRDPPPDGSHRPTMTGKSQGVLRTKMEGGEGTIPTDDQPQTWDGILQGGRLRTMSCSDKVGRWNVLGLQGALLTHFMEPTYMSSLVLGSLHHHGHLSRAVCCRFAELDAELASLGHAETGEPPLTDCLNFKTNHPKLGRVAGGDEMKRHTEKTSGLSLNWKFGDEKAEINDGVTGRPVLPAGVLRSKLSTTCSRISKAGMYSLFLSLCGLKNRPDLLAAKTYKEAKEMAVCFQRAKQCLYKLCQRKGYGSWMKKPFEQEQFGSAVLQQLNINQ